MSTYAIGIDLGTTYSCAGVVVNGNVEIIHNAWGTNTTASCVAFTKHKRLVGKPAKVQGFKNCQNTVFDIKRLIGRKFDDKNVQKDRKSWPFKVINVRGSCGVQVQHEGVEETFIPEELSAMILTKMKRSAETVLGQAVKDAVITVPAYFNDSQRQATMDAATIAGLNVLRIINEPTAAGIAYLLNDKTPKKQNILVYDLGGGTFDVTVMTLEKGSWLYFSGRQRNIWVKATSGDTHLGGQDFDTRLLEYCVKKYKQKHNNDIMSDTGAVWKLKKACEEAKMILSDETETTIEVDGHTNFSLDITRNLFDELCHDLFEKTIQFVKRSLAAAKMHKEEIDEIILVGGSTRIPKIQDLLTKYFNGKSLNKKVHPDEVVAYGAAVQAAILAGNKSDLM